MALTSDSYDGINSPRVSDDEQGGAFVAWSSDSCSYDRPDHGCEHVYRGLLKHIRVGSVLWTRVFADRGTEDIQADGSNGVLWAWRERGIYNDPFRKLGVSRTSSAGSLLWSQTVQDPFDESWVGLEPDRLGGAYTVWYGNGPRDLYFAAMHFGASGSSAWPTGGMIIGDAERNQWPTPWNCVPDSVGGAYFFWNDGRLGLDRLYAVRLHADASTAPGWSDLGDVVCDAPGGQDNPVGVAAGPGAAIVGWLDRRNGYPDIYAQKIGMRISVEVPERPVSSGLSFALYGAEPNPGNGILRIAFSLRSDEPATLDVHDVAGRRVFSRDVGEFGPGRHVVTVPARAGLASGIYVVRLVAGSTSLTKRACVLR